MKLVHQVRGWYSGVELKMSHRQGGPSRTGGREGAYLDRYVTDEQRSRRLIFSSTPWAVLDWRFWGPADGRTRSTRISLDTGLRSRLPKSPIPRRRRYTSLGLGALALLMACLFAPGNLWAENPSPVPTPPLDERVSDLEQRIQAIESIPVVAFALKLRGSTEQSHETTPAPTPQSDSPLELVSWEYRFKEGQHSYEDRHVFSYILRNVSEKPIKLVHGTLLFTDLLGEKIVAVKLNPDVEYPLGQAASSSGEWDVSPLNPGERRMATMNHNDIKATLLIQGVAFDDNSTWTAAKKQ